VAINMAMMIMKKHIVTLIPINIVTKYNYVS